MNDKPPVRRLASSQAKRLTEDERRQSGEINPGDPRRCHGRKRTSTPSSTK
jgi:hypothetical protein